ncbi:MAG TPA: 2-oxoglutarate and iron-dependent oxygenase domain-containing protein [Phenylobacterium sp.]
MSSVPELSLNAFTEGDPAARAGFSKALFEGLETFGFVVLIDHGVDPDLLFRAYGQAEHLFSRPEVEKLQYANGLRGYVPFGVEHAKDSHRPDLKEFWQIGREPSPEADEPLPPNVWPDAPSGFRDTFQALYAALDETGRQLLEALTPGLGLPSGWFDDKVRHGTSILRVLHYPPVRDDAVRGAVRSAAHEDINFLTIMVPARGAGLEIQLRDGTWLPIEIDPGGLIVNSGDMLARLTNGVIPSTTHRVVNPSGPNVSRYSMPFFMHPASSVRLDCLPSCVGAGAKHPPITAGDFLAERLREIGLA